MIWLHSTGSEQLAAALRDCIWLHVAESPIEEEALRTAASGASVVLLNTPESEPLGQQLQVAGVQHVVCWRTTSGKVPRRLFAEGFWGALSGGAHVCAAFDAGLARLRLALTRRDEDWAQLCDVGDPKEYVDGRMAGGVWAAGVPVVLPSMLPLPASGGPGSHSPKVLAVLILAPGSFAWPQTLREVEGAELERSMDPREGGGGGAEWFEFLADAADGRAVHRGFRASEFTNDSRRDSEFAGCVQAEFWFDYADAARRPGQRYVIIHLHFMGTWADYVREHRQGVPYWQNSAMAHVTGLNVRHSMMTAPPPQYHSDGRQMRDQWEVEEELQRAEGEAVYKEPRSWVPPLTTSPGGRGHLRHQPWAWRWDQVRVPGKGEPVPYKLMEALKGDVPHEDLRQTLTHEETRAFTRNRAMEDGDELVEEDVAVLVEAVSQRVVQLAKAAVETSQAVASTLPLEVSPPLLQQPPQQDEAVMQWQRAVVAIGALPANDRPGLPMGSGFCINAKFGVICTCAHVIERIRLLDPAQNVDEMRVVIGDGNPAKWRFVARVRRLSPPAAPRDSRNGLDAALLQLDCAWPNSAVLSSPQIPALPFGSSDTPQLQPGAQLVVLGYGQSDSTRTKYATVTQGIFVGPIKKETTGWWLRTDAKVLGGHSGGPALNDKGELVGWAVSSEMDRVSQGPGCVPSGIHDLRPINALLPEVMAVFAELDPQLKGRPVRELQGEVISGFMRGAAQTRAALEQVAPAVQANVKAAVGLAMVAAGQAIVAASSASGDMQPVAVEMPHSGPQIAPPLAPPPELSTGQRAGQNQAGPSDATPADGRRCQVQLVRTHGADIMPPIDYPFGAGPDQLAKLLQHYDGDARGRCHSFKVLDGHEITTSLEAAIGNASTEKTVQIICSPVIPVKQDHPKTVIHLCFDGCVEHFNVSKFKEALSGLMANEIQPSEIQVTLRNTVRVVSRNHCCRMYAI